MLCVINCANHDTENPSTVNLKQKLIHITSTMHGLYRLHSEHLTTFSLSLSLSVRFICCCFFSLPLFFGQFIAAKMNDEWMNIISPSSQQNQYVKCLNWIYGKVWNSITDSIHSVAHSFIDSFIHLFTRNQLRAKSGSVAFTQISISISSLPHLFLWNALPCASIRTQTQEPTYSLQFVTWIYITHLGDVLVRCVCVHVYILRTLFAIVWIVKMFQNLF